MAVITVSDAGGNWSSTTAWTGGVVPVAGDTVNFTATSGPLTVNVNTANLAGIDFTNYVNTITVSSTLNVTSGTINLGTGGYTQAGASGFGIGGSVTIISNGTVWSRIITFLISSSTITLSDNLTVTGNIIFQSVATYTLNGNTLFVGSNLTMAATLVLGTTNIVFNGTGTWVHTSAGAIQNNVTINSPSGTITIGTNIYYNTGTLTYTAGTVVTTGSTLNIGASTTLNCGNMDGVTTNKWNNITLSGTSQTFTLSSNLNLSGTLTLSGTTAMTLTGNTINVGGNLTVTTTATVSGTTAFLINGTGTWSHGAAGVIRNNLTINTAGTLTIGTSIYYDSGILTYTAGTVNTTTNNSQLIIQSNTTLDTDRGATKISWNLIRTSGAITLTLSSNLTTTNLRAQQTSLTFVLGGSTLSVSGTLSIDGGTTFNTPSNLQVTNLLNGNAIGGNVVINGSFTISISGNLTENRSAGTSSGTTSIVLNGTGTWSTLGTGSLQNNLTINTAGTITISGNVYYNTGTLTYTAGTVTTTGSTLNIGASTTLDTDRGATKISWSTIRSTGSSTTITLSSNLSTTNYTAGEGNTHSISFTLGGNTLSISGNLSIGHNATFNLPSDLQITNLSCGAGANAPCSITGLFNLSVSGNFTQATSQTAISGTSTIILNGTGNWTNSGTGALQTNLTIDTSGTITLGSSLTYNTRTLRYINGTVDATTNNSTLNITAGCIVNTSGMTWNKVAINGSATITLTSDLNVGGLLTLGSLTFTTTINGSGGTRTINASNGITLGGTTAIVTGTANIKITGGTITGVSTVQLRNNLELAGNVTFASGVTFYYNTGTLSHTSGTITTTNSTLNVGASTTFDTVNVTWNNFTTTATSTMTLTSILVVGGTLTLNNVSFATNPVHAQGNITVTTNTGTSGTIIINGTGDQTWNTGGQAIRTNLTINKPSGTLILGASVSFNSGTLTYTAGTVVTTGSTLNVGASTTFDTSGMTWNNIIFTGGTQTLLSDLNIGGNLITQTLAVGLNGAFNVNVGGNFTISETTSGTADIIMVGTGTVTGTVARSLSNNLTINTTGRIVFAQALWMAGTKTIKHIAGDTFVNYGHILQLSSTGNITSLDCAAILWDTLQLGNGANLTLLDDVYLRGNFDRLSNPSSITGNKSIYVGGGLSSVSYAMNGSATFVLTGSGNISLPVDFGFKIILNTFQKYTLTNNFLFNGTDFTIVKGKIISNGYAFYIRNTSTLINFHKINLEAVIVTAGLTITMNEFFSGSPALKTTILSTGTNYNITFQDNFEKIAKFVNISRATFTRRNQLLVITDSKKSSTNQGIRYINQSPNGIPKGDPSVQNILTPGVGTFLVNDPSFN